MTRSRLPLRLALVITVGLLLTVLGAPAQLEENRELNEQMNVVKRVTRTLRRQVSDPGKNQDTITQLLAAQAAVKNARPMIPTKSKELEGEARKKFLTEYRLQLIDLERKLLDIEEHLLQGDNAAAKKIYEGLKALERSSHEKFRD